MSLCSRKTYKCSAHVNIIQCRICLFTHGYQESDVWQIQTILRHYMCNLIFSFYTYCLHHLRYKKSLKNKWKVHRQKIVKSYFGPSAKHCTTHWILTNILCVRYYFYLHFTEGIWDRERLNDLPKIIQLISGMAGIPSQTVWLQIPYPWPQGTGKIQNYIQW